MKDNFSTESDKYARYRPHYPESLFKWIDKTVVHKDVVWDCATGNGQIGRGVANIFTDVYATDISPQQIEKAIVKENIYYSVQSAEATTFENQMFDCIIVGQAIHWFDFEAFYKEVRRVAKKEAKLIVTGYGLLSISSEINAIIHEFYHQTLGRYWDKERQYVDELYQTIPFPFAEIEVPNLTLDLVWTLEQFVGYLQTWSAVKHFVRQEGYSPVVTVEQDLQNIWQSTDARNHTQIVHFPILLRCGVVE